MAKLLLLTPQLPYPPQQGTSLRNYHIIRGLAKRHDVTLLSFVETNQVADRTAVGPLGQLCTAVVTAPVPARGQRQRLAQLLTTRRPDMAHRLASPAFDAQLRRLLNENHFDIVQIEGIELAQAIELIRIGSAKSRIVFDNHNAETELQRRNLTTDVASPARWPAAVYSWVQVSRLRRFEAWACREADWVTAVSETDRFHLQALIPDLQTPVSVIPNCLDVSEYESWQPSSVEKAVSAYSYDLVFSGKMDYRPNVDAVLWFADAVWPLIQRQRPTTTCAIVGQKPHRRLARLRAVPGLTVTGWVESVRPYLAGASVYVLPFRIGTGTRLKLIEAMAAGKAIVSTPIGAEGFPVQSNHHLLLAESAPELAAAILQLLDHPEERRRLGEAARCLARQYDWRRVIPAFDHIYSQLLLSSY